MFQPRIAWVEESQASGDLKKIYDQWLAANPDRERMPDILKCFSQRPDVLEPLLAMTYPLHFSDGYLDRQTKEALATYVSGLNACDY